MTRYRLYAHRNSYAMTTHLLLEELAVDYDIVWFNVHKPDQFPPEFLQLNPHGRVPVLLTPHGPVYESAATMVYLAECHGSRYLPSSTGQQRALAFQWLFYLMSTFQPEVLIQFHPEKYFPTNKAMQDSLKKSSLSNLQVIWQKIDQALDSGPYFLGDEYSLCDMLFIMQAIWKENQPPTFDNLPNISRMMRKVLVRPAVRTILRIHQVEHLVDFAKLDNQKRSF